MIEKALAFDDKGVLTGEEVRDYYHQYYLEQFVKWLKEWESSPDKMTYDWAINSLIDKMVQSLLAEGMATPPAGGGKMKRDCIKNPCELKSKINCLLCKKLNQEIEVIEAKLAKAGEK